MLYIQWKDKDFDFGFESMDNNQIIDFMTKLFNGKRMTGQHKSRLQVKTREDKVLLWDILQNSQLWHCYIDNRLSKEELELLILKIFEGVNNYAVTD